MKLTLNRGQQLFFTSDTHYNHDNICSATTKWIDPVTCREFKSLERMNAALVGNINEVVGQDDILIHLGDWSFGGFERIEEFRAIGCQYWIFFGGGFEGIQKFAKEIIPSFQ